MLSKLSIFLLLLVLICGVESWLEDNRKKCCTSIDAYSKTPNCEKSHACKGDYCVNWELSIHGHPLYVFGCMRHLPFGIPAGGSDGKPKCNGNKLCSCQNSGGDQFLDQSCNAKEITNKSPKWPNIPCPGCQHGQHAQDQCGVAESEYCQTKEHPCLWHGPLTYNPANNIENIWMDCDPKIDLINDLGIYVSPSSWPDGTSVCFSHEPIEENNQDCMCKGTKFGQCFNGGDGTWIPPKYPASQPVVRCHESFGNNNTCFGHFCVQTWQTKGCLNITNPALFNLPTKRANPTCVEVKGRNEHPIWTSCICNSDDFCTERCCSKYAPAPTIGTPPPTTASTFPAGNFTIPQGGGSWAVSPNKLLAVAIIVITTVGVRGL